MPTHVCSVCQRQFKQTQYYMQHFTYKINIKCKRNYQKKLRLWSPIEPNPKVATKPAAKVTHVAAPNATTTSVRRPLDFAQHVTYLANKQPDNVADEMVIADDDTVDLEEAAQNEPPIQMDEDSNQPEEDESSKINDCFKEYVKESLKNRSWLDSDLQAGIELMHVLQANGVVSLYDTLMEWHIAYLEAKKRVTKNQLIERLRKRYNMDGCKPYITKVILPSSGLKARVPCHDAWHMTMDVLTDPRIKPGEDYLWFNDDPLGYPPAEWLEMADINDSLAYRKTWEQRILPQPFTSSGRRKVLMPCIGYMDACVTGATENLGIEFMKFTLGIFNSKARDKDYTWRILGAVPQHQHVKAKAVEMLAKSGHNDAEGYLTMSESEGEDTPNVRKFTREFDFGRYINSSDEEEDMCDIQVPDTHSQDLHVILQVIMSGMHRIFRTGGFEWDLYYNGQVHRLQFIPFLLFMKGDTVEHDKHSGRYGARNRGVKNLCRYCCCPNEETDNPYADFARKNPQMISNLVRKRDMEGLKGISQQYLFNMWYDFGFGLHNQLGIHGACPMELLHWIQLGMYKYSRSTLFEQLGPYSELSTTINTIASQMGWLFQRQSDREYPRTKFTKGVQKGALMAHEMTGVMLVLIATLRSTKGMATVLDDGNANFPTRQAVTNWIMLLETQLQFESWLKTTKMSVAVVIRLRTKVRELMMINKIIGRREKGMKYRTNNFHSTKHVPDDILMFGPPHVVNTKSNEMHHKKDKKSAKSTQKRPATFDFQCTQRVDDRRVIDFGMEELKGRPRWDYYHGFERLDQFKSDRVLEQTRRISVASPNKVNNHPKLTGVKATFRYCDEAEKYVYKVISSMNRKSQYRLPQYIVNVIADLTEELADFVTELTVYSELKMPEGQKYRSSPFFQGKPWYDWAMCRVGEQIEGFQQRIVPVQIRCFVDLTFLPAANPTKYSSAYHMIIEPSRLNPEPDEIQMSDLFVPYLKEIGQQQVNKVQMLSIDRITGPACLIPDVSHPSKRAYLRVRPMSEWAGLFEVWVNSPHAQEHAEPNIGE